MVNKIYIKVKGILSMKILIYNNKMFNLLVLYNNIKDKGI